MLAGSVEPKVERLAHILRECESACIGYSGGVDSALLAKMAFDVLGAANVMAVTGRSASYPQVQLDTARACAIAIGIHHIEIDTAELDDPKYTANPSNRCYFCKAELWPKVAAVARSHGMKTVLDGSNADDAHDYRPGFVAAREHGVRAPLLEAGLTKAEIRELSHSYGLPTWDQPAAPCLSSRLPYGVAVTPQRLQQVERAEAVLRELGFRELRVRHHDDCARIELAYDEIPHAFDSAQEIHERLRAIGLARVLLDAEGYRRGALNEALVQIGSPVHEGTALPPHDVAGFHHDIAVLPGTGLSEARALAGSLRAAGFRYIAVDMAAIGA